VKSFRLTLSTRRVADKVLRGIDTLKRKGIGSDVEVAFFVPESPKEPSWAKGAVIAIRMDTITVQFGSSGRAESLRTQDYGRLWRLADPHMLGGKPAHEAVEAATTRDDIQPLSQPPRAQRAQRRSKLYLSDLSRAPPEIDWDGFNLVRPSAVYKGGQPPSQPGGKFTSMDSDASFACKWCGTKCRSSMLQCTMTRKMIADVQNHLRRRGVSLSWFERAEVTLSSVAGPHVPLAGGTSSKFTPVRVCQTCYEIYVSEMKLMRAERVYGQEIGIPTAKHESTTLQTDISASLEGVRNIKVAVPPENVIDEIPSKLLGFRVMILFDNVDGFPVPLLFGTSGLSLEYEFLGVRTRMPLDVDTASLQREHRCVHN
jgi:hypothetical protein